MEKEWYPTNIQRSDVFETFLRMVIQFGLVFLAPGMKEYIETNLFTIVVVMSRLFVKTNLF